MLEVKGVSKRFGGLAAISGLRSSFRAAKSSASSVPNGAGKTTLLNLITGYSAPGGGTILLEGKKLNGLAPYEICRLGIARTFQVVRPFGEMSVADNVMTGALFASNKWMSTQEAEHARTKRSILVGLMPSATPWRPCLTIGEKKKLELARALATKSKILLLDEVMSGLTGFGNRSRHGRGGTRRRFRHDHPDDRASRRRHRRACDRVLVLNFGRDLSKVRRYEAHRRSPGDRIDISGNRSKKSEAFRVSGAMSSALFSKYKIRDLDLSNRIVVSPMGQYSAENGCATDWHMMHLGHLARVRRRAAVHRGDGGKSAGTANTSDLGLWSDENEEALASIIAFCRKHGGAKLGSQLYHGGRKSSITTAWQGQKPVPSKGRLKLHA